MPKRLTRNIQNSIFTKASVEYFQKLSSFSIAKPYFKSTPSLRQSAVLSVVLCGSFCLSVYLRKMGDVTKKMLHEFEWKVFYQNDIYQKLAHE